MLVDNGAIGNATGVLCLLASRQSNQLNNRSPRRDGRW